MKSHLSQIQLRKNLDDLSVEDLKNLRSAFAQSMQSDNLGYSHHAGIVGYPSFMGWHGPQTKDGWPGIRLYLPWNRANLYTFEKMLQTHQNDITLPFWDWSSTGTKFPKSFSDEFGDENIPNPLFKFHLKFPDRSIDRDTLRFPGKSIGEPLSLPGSSIIEDILNIPGNQFEQFSDELENLQGLIHVWTGGEKLQDKQRLSGDMSSIAFSAYDPIFWSARCMVDKIWWLWQQKNGINKIPEHYKNMALVPFNMTVNDALNIHDLGYDYGKTIPKSVITPDILINQSDIYTSKPIQLKITKAKIIKRADLEFYRILNNDNLYEVRVFLNNEDASKRTPRNEKFGYVGTLNMIEDAVKASGYAPYENYGDVPQEIRYRLPITPYKQIAITDHIKRIIKTAKSVTITAVPILKHPDKSATGKAFKFERLLLAVYFKKAH